MVLQLAVNHVGLPMWLPGKCSEGSHILLRGPRSLDVADLPVEQTWETCYRLVLGLRVPRPIFDIAVKLGVHALEDLVTTSGTAVRTADAVVTWAYISLPVAKVYSKWVVTHSDFLRSLRATDKPLWTSGPDVWEPAISETPSVTVVGGQGAKLEKVRIIPVADSLLEVDEDLLDSLGPLAASLLRICALDLRGARSWTFASTTLSPIFLRYRRTMVPHYGPV